MQTIPLYRYERDSGKITDSTIKPAVEYTEHYRLIAKEGFILTGGGDPAFCIDTDEPEKWSELEFTPDEPEEATKEDYQNALTEFGVEL